MLFKELEIKPSYDSRKSDVFNDFFNPVLSNSKHYRRFGGIFSAKRFALFAEGLQDFIKENNGTMELAVIPSFSEEDKKALLDGVLIDDIVARNWINDLSKIKEKMLEDHTKAISWMIANDYLTIKIILPEHKDGTFFSESELNDLAIFRKEIGVFYNKDDDSLLSFHGTIDRDDSEVGELYSLDVSRDWIDSEKDQINLDHEDFTNYWNDEIFQLGQTRCTIRPLSQKLESYFKEKSPKTQSEIPVLKKLPILRKYQLKAIDAWLQNDGRGIFEMATGTGKTFTAIGCIKRVQDNEERILVIIAVPYRNLLDQWRQELSKWFINSVTLESGTWRQTLRDEVSHLNNSNDKESSVLVVSHDLFSTKEFVDQIERCKISTMLIVDEAHHVGTITGIHGLSKNYHYRLALSATIARYFDDDGTDLLRQYFKSQAGKSTVIEYSLKDAINDGRLCGYNYYPFFIQLTDDEITEYQRLTYKAVRLLNSKKLEERKKGEIVLQRRAKIIRDAENKTDCLKEILQQIPKLEHLLIFCSENQFDNVDGILSNLSKHCGIDKSVAFRKITFDNPSNKKDRITILDDFASGDWNILLSNRILDEGMDIPQARTCIVLASTGNPTQFIQRRGRVLRQYAETYPDGSKKTHADIFDILIKPQIANLSDPNSVKLETSIVRGQLNKIKQMSNLAINHDYCTKQIEKFTAGLPLEL